MSKEDFKKVFDKYAIDFKEEPVSEELIDVAKQYVKEHVIGIDKVTFSIATDMFISGATWQKAHNWPK
jgi:hemerythrin